jgi:hypothetical protein
MDLSSAQLAGKLKSDKRTQAISIQDIGPIYINAKLRSKIFDDGLNSSKWRFAKTILSPRELDWADIKNLRQKILPGSELERSAAGMR